MNYIIKVYLKYKRYGNAIVNRCQEFRLVNTTFIDAQEHSSDYSKNGLVLVATRITRESAINDVVTRQIHIKPCNIVCINIEEEIPF